MSSMGPTMTEAMPTMDDGMGGMGGGGGGGGEEGDADNTMMCQAAHLDEMKSSGIIFRTNSSSVPDEFPSEYPDDSHSTLLPCSTCNRTFNLQALERHLKVCERLSSRRRKNDANNKTFSSTKQRVEGLEISPSLPSRGKTPDGKAQAKSKSKWREKHQEFLRAIRAAKGMPDSDENGDGLPISTVPSDYIQCPQCERYFGPKAADRHIDWCKEKGNRMAPVRPNSQAAERLKTRTKYIPPKPGQNGWRAPKKSDVISSIPPPSSGPTPTPPGPLGSREFSPPANRQFSPPRSLARQSSPPLHMGRHLSPPPMTSSRRTSVSSVASLGRSGSMSLGRSAGKQLSAMLRSVTGQSSGYGSSAGNVPSSGYGQSSRYGQSSGYGQSSTYGQQSPGYGLSRVQVGRSSFSGGVPPLVRQGSMRSSLRRTSSSTPMARHRDLASDMMASVCIGGNPKRGEPEGDEAGESLPDCSSSLESTYSKLEDAPYDPFSAAELQMEALMGPSKSSAQKGSGLGAAGLGLGVSMMDSIRMEVTGRESPDFDFDIGLEEFEKEYRSTKELSPEYNNSSKSRTRNNRVSDGNGLGRSGSFSELDLEPTIGSPTPGKALEQGWPWKANPSTPSGRWSVGTASPTFHKPSWSAPKETLRNRQYSLSSMSSENLSKDVNRWPSPTRETTREDSRSFTSPTRDTNWSALTRDIHNWSSSSQDNHNLSSNYDTRSWSSPSRDSHCKSSPVREVGRDSPLRDTRSWTSPTRENQSPIRDANRWSSPSRDSHRESSPFDDTRSEARTYSVRSWSSPTRDARSPSRDSLRCSSVTYDNHNESSPARDTKSESPTREIRSWSSPTRDKYAGESSTTSDNHRLSSPSRGQDKENSYSSSRNKESSPSRDVHRWSSPSRDQDKENSYSSSRNKESSPSRDVHRWSSPLRDLEKDNSYSSNTNKESSPARDVHRWSSPTPKSLNETSAAFDARSWSSPPRERLNDSSPTHSWSSALLENKKESPLFRSDNKQKESSVAADTSDKIQTRDDQTCLPPIIRTHAHDANNCSSSIQDRSSLVNSSPILKSRGEISLMSTPATGWSGGESSSGLSSLGSVLSKYSVGGPTATQRNTSTSITALDGGGTYSGLASANKGFESFRTSRDAVDGAGDGNSIKKACNSSSDDPQLRVSSGSSSDSSSLPPLSSPSSSTSPAGNAIGDTGSASSSMKMPRFCHECGHKYPVLLAKFCCHCGSRRASVDH